jgi:hypothetical protein
VIAAFIAERGVTRAVSFGVHQAAVDALRRCANDVQRTRRGTRYGSPWMLNGFAMTTVKFYAAANKARAQLGLAPLAIPKEAT